MNVEPLEPRIAPASAFVTYTDADGDLVRITASKPGSVAPPLDAADLTQSIFIGLLGQLQKLDLTDPGFEGAKIVFSVTRKPGGDGLAHVGFIDAFDRSLDQVVVRGDLGKIVVGDPATTDDTDLKLLSVRSLGMLGLVTGAPDLASVVYGKLGKVAVARDLADATLSANGGFTTVSIGGNVTGRIVSAEGIGSVGIGGSLVGGGAEPEKGQIRATGAIGAVAIAGDVIGGGGLLSGYIASNTGIGLVRIGGNLAGGAGSFSGLVWSDGAIGAVRIGGDVTGGAGHGGGQISNAGSIDSVMIGGSLIAGNGVRSGAIVAGDEIGPIKIRGSIIGNSTNPALIIAQGQAGKPATGFDLAIAGLTVGGGVRFAKILAGFDSQEVPLNADASIGGVNVGRDWVASSIVAGARDAGAAGFGLGDTLQTVANTGLIARIASITIKGDATGSLATGDHFGFVAQQIDRLKIGPRTFPSTPGAGNDAVAILFTNDLRLLEVT